MDNIIFTTPHGSHLYGLAHEGSDNDSMIVYGDTRPAKHRKHGDQDVIHVGVYALIEMAQSGSHQFAEGVMSQKKIWHDETWRPYIEGLQLPPAQIGEKYERTIKKLCFEDSFKLRRHAVRLWCNLSDMRIHSGGRFDPTLNKGDVLFVSKLAKDYRDRELRQILLPRGDFS